MSAANALSEHANTLICNAFSASSTSRDNWYVVVSHQVKGIQRMRDYNLDSCVSRHRDNIESKKTAPFYFCNNFVKPSSILIFCGTLYSTNFGTNLHQILDYVKCLKCPPLAITHALITTDQSLDRLSVNQTLPQLIIISHRMLTDPPL